VVWAERPTHLIGDIVMASQGVAAFRDIRELTAVFDQDRFGLNVRVGVWYFVAQLITSFTWMIVPLLRGWDVGPSPIMYYVALAAVSGGEAAALVVVLHRVRETWGLVAAVGAVAAASGAATRGVLKLFAFEGWTVGPIFDPLLVGSGFMYGAALMLGLVIAVRRWGTAPGSFMAGGAGGIAVQSAIFQTASLLTSDAGTGIAGSASVIPMVLGGVVSGGINGAVVGGLMYVGVAQHMKLRGVPAVAVPERQPVPAFAPVASPGPVRTVPVPAATVHTPSSPGTRQHYFVCCGNPSMIAAFMEVYGVARAAGWGEFRRLHASVFGGEFAATRRAAAAAEMPFAGKEVMGGQSWATSSLDQLLGQIQAGVSGDVHVAYGITTAARAEWMKSTYETLIGEGLKQGILPFRMYVTESDAAAAALLGALEED
jgi:hypothetical protein